jgi:hypothetical protein
LEIVVHDQRHHLTGLQRRERLDRPGHAPASRPGAVLDGLCGIDLTHPLRGVDDRPRSLDDRARRDVQQQGNLADDLFGHDLVELVPQRGAHRIVRRQHDGVHPARLDQPARLLGKGPGECLDPLVRPHLVSPLRPLPLRLLAGKLIGFNGYLEVRRRRRDDDDLRRPAGPPPPPRTTLRRRRT